MLPTGEQLLAKQSQYVLAETNFKTMAQEEVGFLRELSPADRLGRGGGDHQQKRGPGKGRGRL